MIYLYVLCFVSTGLIYKAFWLGLVLFLRGNSVLFFLEICSTNGPSPVEVRGVTSSYLKTITHLSVWTIRLYHDML